MNTQDHSFWHDIKTFMYVGYLCSDYDWLQFQLACKKVKACKSKRRQNHNRNQKDRWYGNQYPATYYRRLQWILTGSQFCSMIFRYGNIVGLTLVLQVERVEVNLELTSLNSRFLPFTKHHGDSVTDPLTPPVLSLLPSSHAIISSNTPFRALSFHHYRSCSWNSFLRSRLSR